MEQIQKVFRTQSVGYLTPLRIPAYLRLVFSLLIGFSGANLIVRTLAVTTLVPPNPFATYADIFPGQPDSAIQSRAFSCRIQPEEHPIPTGILCSFVPTEGIFSKIKVITSQSAIQNTIFEIREKNLRVGDVEAFLKIQTMPNFSKIVYFTWPVLKYPRRSSWFFPVWSISFTKQ